MDLKTQYIWKRYHNKKFFYEEYGEQHYIHITSIEVKDGSYHIKYHREEYDDHCFKSAVLRILNELDRYFNVHCIISCDQDPENLRIIANHMMRKFSDEYDEGEVNLIIDNLYNYATNQTGDNEWAIYCAMELHSRAYQLVQQFNRDRILRKKVQDLLNTIPVWTDSPSQTS